jgi:hypothetical protein
MPTFNTMPLRTILVLFSALLLTAEPLKLPEPYQSIVDLAHATPPEFAADALLRVVESGKIGDPESRRDLLTQAFRLAASAKFTVRMRALPGAMIDTRSGYLSQAYDLKLDALSLQSRAAMDMLATDKPNARELFQEIPRPALTPLTCDDPLVYDLSDFYLALGAMVNSAFTEKERAKQEHLTFLLDYLGQTTSAAQLAPLARVLKNAAVTPEQRDLLWTRYNGLLENMPADARSCSAAVADISREIVPEMEASFEKFRQRSARCTDDSATSVTLELKAGPAPAGSTPHVQRYWESAEAKRVLEGAKKLRDHPGGNLLSDAERSTREWQQQITDYLNELAAWVPSQEKSEADYFHQKCVVYQALLQMIPPGPRRDQILETFMSFVGNSNLQQESPVEWFKHVQSMLNRVRDTNSVEAGKVLEALGASGNPVLALYAALERTFVGNIPAWAPKTN